MPYAKLPIDFPEPPKLPKRYFEDSRWGREHIDELVQKYPDMWVAILEQEVVVASTDLAEVDRVARQKTDDVGKGQCVYKFIETPRRVHHTVGVSDSR